MLRYVVKRLIMLVPIFMGVTLITSGLLHLVPGDPVTCLLGANPQIPPKVGEDIRREMGLDQPFHIQYLTYIWRILHGDLGTNYRTQRPVLDEIMERFPNTVALAILAIAIALAIAIPVGIISAVKRYSLIDVFALTLSTLGVAIPNFWLSLILILTIGYYFRLLPMSGIGGIEHLILPSISLGIGVSGWIVRLLRSCMLEVLGQDYILAARAKGLSKKVLLLKHALKNAIAPVITMVGIRFGYLLGGAVVIEMIFAYPGLGFYILNAIYQRNYPVIMGSLVFTSLTFVIINLVIDILYAYFDPRIRLGKGGKK